jgi:hypothetical protein
MLRLFDWLGGFPQKAVKIVSGINRMPQRPRRVQQTALGQAVNGDFGDAQICGRFRTLVSLFLNMCFRFRAVESPARPDFEIWRLSLSMSILLLFLYFNGFDRTFIYHQRPYRSNARHGFDELHAAHLAGPPNSRRFFPLIRTVRFKNEMVMMSTSSR